MTDFTAPAAPVAQEVKHLRMTIDYLVVVTPEVPEVPAVIDPETEEEIIPAIPAVPESKELVKKGSFRCEVPFDRGPEAVIQEDAMGILSATETGHVVAIMDRIWPKAYALGDDTEPITT